MVCSSKQFIILDIIMIQTIGLRDERNYGNPLTESPRFKICKISCFIGLIPFGYNMAFCKHCGNELPSQDADICTHCGKLIREIPSPSGTITKRPSSAWYLLPIFFGIIGGLIMFFVIKDEDRKMAKKGFIIGIILSAIGIIFYGIMYAAMFASLASMSFAHIQ